MYYENGSCLKNLGFTVRISFQPQEEEEEEEEEVKNKPFLQFIFVMLFFCGLAFDESNSNP